MRYWEEFKEGFFEMAPDASDFGRIVGGFVFAFGAIGTGVAVVAAVVFTILRLGGKV